MLQGIGYKRIKLEEREKIYNFVRLGYNQSKIAELLGRHRSSICNELRRGKADALGYLPDRANACAAKLMRKNLKIFRSNKLCQQVIDKLKLGWSPEQIAGRIGGRTRQMTDSKIESAKKLLANNVPPRGCS